jgi:hypothetical protein
MRHATSNRERKEMHAPPTAKNQVVYCSFCCSSRTWSLCNLKDTPLRFLEIQLCLPFKWNGQRVFCLQCGCLSDAARGNGNADTGMEQLLTVLSTLSMFRIDVEFPTVSQSYKSYWSSAQNAFLVKLTSHKKEKDRDWNTEAIQRMSSKYWLFFVISFILSKRIRGQYFEIGHDRFLFIAQNNITANYRINKVECPCA